MNNFGPDQPLRMNLPVKAGFPNPVEDAAGMALDLNQLLVKHPVSTYYLRIQGDSMVGMGVSSGDIVVVDRSLDPKSGDLVIAALDGDFILKQLKKEANEVWLVSANPDYPPVSAHEATDFALWGVVTWIIHSAGK